MFCPECRTEFRPGFTVCSDCEIELVHELKEEAEPERVEYVQVLFTYNPFDIAFIKSLFDAEGIVYYFHGENFVNVQPMVDPSRLMVNKEQADEARELLKDANLSIVASARSDEED